jgi:hypothetical protein
VEIYVRDLSDRRQRVLAVVKTPMWMCAKVIGSSWWGRVRRPGGAADASPVRIDYSCGSPCAIGINARSDNNSARVRVGP